ncbi:MAG: acyltransferase [Myxococcota bacterium]
MSAGTPPPSRNLFWIDALRMAAAVAVVLLHVSAEPVVLVKDRSSLVWWTGNLLDSAMRWCVPIFVMLSGALLLDRRKESSRTFFTRRVRRLALPILAWTLAYFAFQAARRGWPGWGEIGSKLLEGRPEYHMWYVYMTLGLYLWTPLLRRFVARVDRRTLWATTGAALLVAALHDALYSFRGVPMFRSVFTLYLPYLGYYLAGHVLLHHRPRVPLPLLLAIVAACVGVVAAGTHFLMERWGILPAGLYLYEYLSPPVVVMSLAVFLIGMRIPAPAAGSAGDRIVRDMSAATLGIYLIHPMLIVLLRRQGISAVELGAAGAPVVALVVVVAAYLLVSLLRRTPVLRQAV